MSQNNFLKILSFFIFPAIVFLLSWFLGSAFHVYSIYWWFDIPMHFLGGVAISFTVVMFLKFFKEKKILEIKSKILFVLIVVAFVGLIAIFWEFYEFFLKTFFNVDTQSSVADTMLDFFMGLLGGLFGGISFRNV